MISTRQAGFLVLALVVFLGCERSGGATGAVAEQSTSASKPTIPVSAHEPNLQSETPSEVEAPPADKSANETLADSTESSPPDETPKPADTNTVARPMPPTDDRSATSDDIPAPPAKPNGNLYRITFDDLKLDMPVDTKLRPQMLTDRVKELNGQRISLKGFIYTAGIFQQEGIKEFLLVMNTQCKFGPGGEAFCVIPVSLKDGAETSFTVRPITVDGILTIDPFQGPDGNTWSVYRIAGDRVKL